MFAMIRRTALLAAAVVTALVAPRAASAAVMSPDMTGAGEACSAAKEAAASYWSRVQAELRALRDADDRGTTARSGPVTILGVRG